MLAKTLDFSAWVAWLAVGDAGGTAASSGRGPVGLEPRINVRLDRIEHRGGSRYDHAIRCRTWVAHRKRNGLARVVAFFGDLPLALTIEQIRPSNQFFLVHLNHPSSGVVGVNRYDTRK